MWPPSVFRILGAVRTLLPLHAVIQTPVFVQELAERAVARQRRGVAVVVALADALLAHKLLLGERQAARLERDAQVLGETLVGVVVLRVRIVRALPELPSGHLVTLLDVPASRLLLVWERLLWILCQPLVGVPGSISLASRCRPLDAAWALAPELLLLLLLLLLLQDCCFQELLIGLAEVETELYPAIQCGTGGRFQLP